MRPMTTTRFNLAAAFGTLCLSIALAEIPIGPVKNAFAADEWKLPVEKPALKQTVGVELVVGNCRLCHSVDYVATQPPLLRAQWMATVEKMRGKFGATIPTNQVPAIVDYLTINYGRESAPK